MDSFVLILALHFVATAVSTNEAKKIGWSWVANKGNSFLSPCQDDDMFAPCACKLILTNIKLIYKDKCVSVEFPEAICHFDENAKRAMEGRIADHHRCEQLYSDRIVHKDTSQQPIHVPIHFKSACELMCEQIVQKNWCVKLNS